MKPTEDYADFLQNIEFGMVQVWKGHPDMTNYDAMRAYDAAIAYYNAQARDQTPKPVTLTGIEATLWAHIQSMCEWRLGRQHDREMPQTTPIPLEDMVSCLRKLRKSVDFWTKRGGRQGYMQYIEKFVA